MKMIKFSSKSNVKIQQIDQVVQKELNFIFNSLKTNNLKNLKQLQIENIIKNIKTLSKKGKLTLQTKNRLQEILKIIQENIQKYKNLPIHAKLKTLENEIKKILIQSSNENTNKTFNATPKKFTQKNIKNLNAILKEYVLDDNKEIKKSSIKLLSNSKIIKNIGNITKNLQTILNLIKDQPSLKRYQPVLENFTKSINKIDIKDNIQNSGILYEAKLKDNILKNKSVGDNLTNDLKAVLLNIKKDNKNSINNPLIDKLSDKSISQIQSNQINSILNSNFTSFIPFAWEDLKDGKLSFKYYKKTKNFTCKIELDLEKYGNINILLMLNDSNLSVGINAKNKLFENKIIKNLKDLKILLNDIGLSTNIFFLKDKKQYEYGYEDVIKLGMDIKA